MRILFLGANGFIGSWVLSRLLADGHEVCAAVRNPERLARRFPEIAAVHADLNRMIGPEDWRPLLGGVDAVINCAGALQSGRGQNLHAIHLEAPLALYRAWSRRRCGAWCMSPLSARTPKRVPTMPAPSMRPRQL